MYSDSDLCHMYNSSFGYYSNFSTVDDDDDDRVLFQKHKHTETQPCLTTVRLGDFIYYDIKCSMLSCCCFLSCCFRFFQFFFCMLVVEGGRFIFLVRAVENQGPSFCDQIKH